MDNVESTLKLKPRCAVFVMDETGHESFADPNYPVFGIGGCAFLAGAGDSVLTHPWRTMKAEYFGGVNTPLHASDLKNPSKEQLDALSGFFQLNKFGRFAVTMTRGTQLPSGVAPYEVMVAAMRKRWEELASRFSPTIEEIAILFEDSQRGNPLVEKFFGTTVAQVSEQEVTVHHGFIRKEARFESLEVADFVIHAAGRQAFHRMNGKAGIRADFRAVFHANEMWTSYVDINNAEGS